MSFESLYKSCSSEWGKYTITLLYFGENLNGTSYKDVGPLCTDAADVSHLGDLTNSVMMADFANLHEK